MPDRRALLQDWWEFLVAESYVLHEYPDLLWQQAANQPERSAPARQVAMAIAEGRSPWRPWLRQINRAERRSCRMVLVGHRSAIPTQIAPSCTIWGLGLTGSGLLVSGGGDGTIRITDLASGREFACWKAHEYVRALAVSGDRIVSGGDHTIRLWDVGQDTPIAAHETEGIVRAVAISPSGDWALAGGDGFLWLWNLETNSRVDLGRHLPDSRDVDAVTFLGNPRRFAFGRDDGVLIVNLGGKNWRAPAHHARGLAYLSARDWVIYLDPHYRAWRAVDASSGVFVHRLVQGHSERLTAIAATPDGTRVITGSRDASIWVWDAESAEPVGTISGHGWDVTALLALPDGRLVSGSEDGTIRVWNLDALEGVPTTGWAKRRHIARVTFTPDDKVLAWRKGDAVYELDAATGRLLGTAPEPGPDEEAVEPEHPAVQDGYTASIGDRVLSVHDAQGAVVCRYVGPTEFTSVARSGKRIAVGGRGGIVVLLELVLPPQPRRHNPRMVRRERS